MNRFWTAVIAASAAILVLVIADELRAYWSLTRQFPVVEMNTVVLRCSPEHFYGRRVRVIGEADKFHAFYACYDSTADRWNLAPIPGAAR